MRCETNGIQVHYRRTGRGSPVVLLHGLTGSGACWGPVARSLADHDVVLPDARGHGGSSTPATGYRYDDLASDVIELVETLGLVHPVVVGHSMGGMTAALLAIRAPLRGLVLVDPTFLSPARQREVAASDVVDQHRRLLARPIAEVVADLRTRHPHRSDEMIELVADARMQTSLAAFAVLAPPIPDHHELVRAITVPTLLVIGDEPVVTPDMATALRELNPLVRVEQIQHAGHGVPFDQPERLGALIASFLRQLE